MKKNNINFINSEQLADILSQNNIIVIASKNIVNLLFEIHPVISKKCIILSEDESIKSIKNLELILEKMINLNANKNTLLVGFGGGEISDITGFIASIFMRGIRVNFVPTTLLAMVDAAIGGKNAMNFKNIKNIIGTIYQPENIYINVKFLYSLQNKDIIDGMTEIIKISLLKNVFLLDKIKANWNKIISRESEILSEIIRESINLKLKIVYEDEFDLNQRKLLNFGHTIGHLFELNYNISHGEAVLAGMYIESKIAYKMGFISNDLLKNIHNYLSLLNNFDEKKFDLKKIINEINYDKKITGKVIDFPVIDEIGNAKLAKVNLSEFVNIINNF